MVGLLDIAPSTRTVQVDGNPVTVTGVSAHGIAYLLQRFPELRKLMGGRELDINPEQMMALVPDAIAAIIAAGCGYPNNEKAEQLAASLSADVQMDLLSAVLELTMPKGAGPFFAKVQSALGAFDASVKTVDMKLPSQSSS